MKTEFLTIKIFFGKRNFVIPNYQRGYKWAVKEEGKNLSAEGKSLSAVEKIMEDLTEAYKHYKNDPGNAPSYFIQGITVSEVKDEDNNINNIILIDGQQRTTTLYLLLWCIDPKHIDNIVLYYKIRDKSREYICNLKNKGFNYKSGDDTIQDIYYFKKAIKQIKKYLEEIDNKNDFLQYVLEKVQILYIVIDKDKATKTFTMMNGNKATMLQEELVKAEMLRLISLPDIEKKEVSTSIDDNLAELKEIIAKDWETNTLRSRYAREWDKWMYWWNRPEVKGFFGVKSPMDLLLKCYYKKQLPKNEFNFENFRQLIKEKKSAKEHFKGLRDLQKSFEDIFNTPKIHNYLGISLIDPEEDKYKIITYFIDNKKNPEILKRYSEWRMVGATHTAITIGEDKMPPTVKAKEDCAQEYLTQLTNNIVYGQYDQAAYKQLLLLNVDEDNKLNRFFDFGIWQPHNKSLEHIHPKSKVYFAEREKMQCPVWKRGDGKDLTPDDKKEIIQELKDIRKKNKDKRIWINRADFKKNGSEHCIGNLVLLYGNDNTQFGNKPFLAKKKAYFNTEEEFKSRHLLHSVSIFAEDVWRETQIQQNMQRFLERFKQTYDIKD